MELTQVLIKPRITEKMTELAEAANRVAFLVNPKANKLEVKKAVEQAFGVTVLGVNIVSIAPRARKRQGRVVGTKPGMKKAYVTLADGDTIAYFEGA